eukprot:223353_1
MSVNGKHVFLILNILYLIWYFWKVVHRPKLYHSSNALTNSIVQQCKSLRRRYFPLYLFHSGYPQLLISGFIGALYPKCFKPDYTREMYTLHDGQNIALDWIFPPQFNQNNTHKPIVVALYGISGNNKSLNVMRYCRLVCDRLQFASVVLGRRGHEADIELTVPKMSVFGLQQDIHQCLLHIHHQYPDNPLVLLGDSAGTGFWSRYSADLALCTNEQCANEHERSTSQYIIKQYANAQLIIDSILCSVLISPGYDIGQIFGKQGWFSQRLMLFLLKRTFVRQHSRVLSEQNEPIIQQCDRSSSMLEFFETYSGAMSGYESYNQFLTEANPTETVQYAQVPALIINSRDDPICTAASLDEWKWIYEKDNACPNCILVETKFGSHCSFLSTFGGFWLDSVILEYLQTIWKIKSEEMV